MTENDGRSGAAKSQPKRTGKLSRMDVGFDRWLTGQLREMYDEVLREEVPDDLVRMVRQFDRASAADPEAEGIGEGCAERPQPGAHRAREGSGR